eukprot:scaffold1020_cov74-Phaeocystis_antarctica.AAC.1
MEEHKHHRNRRGLAGPRTPEGKHQTTSFTLRLRGSLQQIYVDRLAVRLSGRSLEPNPARRAAVEVPFIPRKFGVPARPVSGVSLPTGPIHIHGSPPRAHPVPDRGSAGPGRSPG